MNWLKKIALTITVQDTRYHIVKMIQNLIEAGKWELLSVDARITDTVLVWVYAIKGINVRKPDDKYLVSVRHALRRPEIKQYESSVGHTSMAFLVQVFRFDPPDDYIQLADSKESYTPETPYEVAAFVKKAIDSQTDFDDGNDDDANDQPDTPWDPTEAEWQPTDDEDKMRGVRARYR